MFEIPPLILMHDNGRTAQEAYETLTLMGCRRGYIAAVFLADSFNRSQFSNNANEWYPQIRVSVETATGPTSNSSVIDCGDSGIKSGDMCCVFELNPLRMSY